MTQLFSKADATEYQADPAKVLSLLLVCQKELPYGIMEITYAPQDQVILFFAENRVMGVYTIHPDGWKREPITGFSTLFQSAESQVRILSLPVEGIRIGKMLIEGIEWSKSFELHTEDLNVRLKEWKQKSNLTLCHLQWQGAEAVVIIPGHSLQAHTALFTSKEQCLGGDKAIARAVSWPEVHCEVKTCSEHCPTEAYEEYRLSQVFSRSLEMILNRFSSISGSRLANRMCEAFTEVSAAEKMNISFMDCLVSDDMIFPSSQAACGMYQTLIGKYLPPLQEVIGSKMTGMIVQETIDSLNNMDHGILSKYPIFAPEKALHE